MKTYCYPSFGVVAWGRKGGWVLVGTNGFRREGTVISTDLIKTRKAKK